MKIGFLYHIMESFGGIENVIMWTAQEMKRRGHEVVIISGRFSDNIIEDLKANDLSFAEIDCNKRIKNINNVSHFSDKLKLLIKDIDVLNVHNFPSNIWAYNVKKDFPAKKMILTLHEPDRSLYEDVMNELFLKSGLNLNRKPWTVFYDKLAQSRWIRLDKMAVKSFEHVITNSKYTASKIKKIYNIEAEVCYFGIPVDLINLKSRNLNSVFSFKKTLKQVQGDAVECHAELVSASILNNFDNDDKKYFFTASRFSLLKNISTIIKSFSIFNKNKIKNDIKDDIYLRISGTGDEADRLKALVKKEQLEEKVVFLGKLSREELAQNYINAVAIVFVPIEEPYGLVAIEAGNYGKCIIASDHAGPAEIVKDRETGLLVSPFLPQDIANAMTELVGNPEKTKMYGVSAQLRMSKLFSFKRYADDFEKIFYL